MINWPQPWMGKGIHRHVIRTILHVMSSWRGPKQKPCGHKTVEKLRHIDDAGRDERGV